MLDASTACSTDICSLHPHHPTPHQDGDLDPAALSTLPPSLAIELMLRMRERQQAANRAQFEARAAAPADFSQFQMAQYLAATQFRWMGC